MTGQPTIQHLLSAATAVLRERSPTARLDAELLLAHVLSWPRARLLAEREHVLDQQQREAFEALLDRRAALEPIAYLTGHKEFYGLDFVVDQRVLVPRPETELLVGRVLTIAAKMQHAHIAPVCIADIGTGSGCIAVTLAVHVPEARLQAVDLSESALEVAAINVARHNVGKQVTLLKGDLLAPLTDPLDIIVSNPPYTILAEVDPGVLRYEPHLALDGGLAGLEVYECLLAQTSEHLHPHGAILLEIGAWQGLALLALAQQYFPNAAIGLHQDLAGRDRVLEIKKR